MKLSRRTFLQAAAGTGVVLAAKFPLKAEVDSRTLAYPENGTLIPDSGWRLWIDDKARWHRSRDLPGRRGLGRRRTAEGCGRDLLYT